MSSEDYFLYPNYFLQGCDYEKIEEMLLSNVEPLCRDLTLNLRQLTRRNKAKRINHSVQKQGLPTLLRFVLRLKNVGDQPGLRDTLNNLLNQLDVSWSKNEPELTTEILEIILIFVKSFENHEENEQVENKEDPEKDWRRWNEDEGAITRLLLGKELLREYS